MEKMSVQAVVMETTPFHQWIFLVLGFGCVWIVYYLCLWLLTPSMTHLMRSRVVSCTHAMLAVASTSVSLFIMDAPVFSALGENSTSLHNFIFCMSLGYFLFEITWCILHRTEDATMISHHILCMVIYMVVLSKGKLGTELCAILFGGEITNPFLQTRYFLRAQNLHLTWYGQLNDATFMLVFLFMRLVMGTWMTHGIVTKQHPELSLVIKLGSLALYVISLVFSMTIFRYAFRKFKKPYQQPPQVDRDEHVQPCGEISVSKQD